MIFETRAEVLYQIIKQIKSVLDQVTGKLTQRYWDFLQGYGLQNKTSLFRIREQSSSQSLNNYSRFFAEHSIFSCCTTKYAVVHHYDFSSDFSNTFNRL